MLTAGNLIGAAPPSLNAEQLALFQAHSRRSFAAVVDQAIAVDADLMLIAGGLFARSEPGLDDIRFASQCLGRARDAGIVAIALDEADNPAADSTGIAFLEELGLVAGVRSDGGIRSRTVDIAGVVLEVGAPSAFGHADPAPHHATLRIALTGESDALQRPEAMAADVIVLGNRPDPGQRQLESVFLICPGWSAPAVAERRPEAGFALVDLDQGGVIAAEFRELAGVAPVVVTFTAGELADRDSDGVIRERVTPLIGNAPLVTLEFVGEFSRELWHRCRVADLSRQASADGTLVHLDLSQLDITTAPADASPTRSFVVEVRRAAEQLTAGAAPADDADTVARARRLVVDGFRRRAESRVA
ncbi:MAG: hypothetical protein OXG43_06925 [Chloroflexi bacterium]|nr:hypothetical protein [Chloroflexota bacterium]